MFGKIWKRFALAGMAVALLTVGACGKKSSGTTGDSGSEAKTSQESGGGDEKGTSAVPGYVAVDESAIKDYVEGKYILYDREGFLICYDWEKEEEQRIGYYASDAAMTKDCSKVVYISDGKLYYHDMADVSKESTLLAEKADGFILDDTCENVTYVQKIPVKCSEEAWDYGVYNVYNVYKDPETEEVFKDLLSVYRVDYNNGKTEKVADNVSDFCVSKDGNVIVLRSFDPVNLNNMLMRYWVKAQKMEVVEEDTDATMNLDNSFYPWITREDCRKIYYVKDGALWLADAKLGKRMITSEMVKIYSISEEGEVYFTKHSNFMLPPVITETNMDALFENMDEEQVYDLKNYIYKRCDKNKVRANEKEEYKPETLKKKYPIYETEVIYVLKANELERNLHLVDEAQKIIIDAGYTQEDFERDLALCAEEFKFEWGEDLYYYNGSDSALLCERIESYFASTTYPVMAFEASKEGYPCIAVKGSVKQLGGKVLEVGQARVLFDEKSRTLYYLERDSGKEEASWVKMNVGNGLGEGKVVDSISKEEFDSFTHGSNRKQVAWIGADGQFYYLKNEMIYKNQESVLGNGDRADYQYVRCDYDQDNPGRGIIIMECGFDEENHHYTWRKFFGEDGFTHLWTEEVDGEGKFEKYYYRSGIACYVDSENKLYANLDVEHYCSIISYNVYKVFSEQNRAMGYSSNGRYAEVFNSFY